VRDITVYLDESGTHDASRYTAVSAVWAPDEVWALWTVDWIKAKAPVKVHHTVDCHNFRGEYEGWSKIQHNFYVGRILSVIRSYEIHGRVAAYDKRELRTRLSDRPDILNWLPNAYEICLQWVLKGVWHELKRQNVTRINFIHERNDYMLAAQEAYRYVRDANFQGQPTSSFSFASKVQRPALQCADFFAYEGNQQMRSISRGLERGERPLPRKPLLAVDPHGTRTVFQKYSTDEVRQMAEQVIELYDNLSSADRERG